MEEEGKVSIWAGNLNSKSVLDKYMEEIFDEEGDSNSQFMSDFKIDYIDIDFQEVDYDNEKMSLQDKLNGCSYFDSFVNQLPETNSLYNSVVCIYNFKYKSLINYCGDLKYIGCFNYQEN